MPVYEFKCPDDDCKETSDVVAAYEDLIIPWCIRHQREMRRVYSPPAIQFRGSGFYSRGG